MTETVILTPRLRLAFERIPQDAEYIDVGTDHAYLPAALITAGRLKFATATDVREGPLEMARQTAIKYSLGDRLRFVCANGLDFDYGCPDAVSICGMGGELIAEIISKANLPDKCLLLLQPMTKKAELRRYLCDNGYFFDESYAVEGDKVFVMIRAKKSETPNAITDNASLLYGYPEKGLKKSPEYKAYLTKALATEQKRYDGLSRSSDQKEIIDALKEAKTNINIIQSILDDIRR